MIALQEFISNFKLKFDKIFRPLYQEYIESKDDIKSKNKTNKTNNEIKRYSVLDFVKAITYEIFEYLKHYERVVSDDVPDFILYKSSNRHKRYNSGKNRNFSKYIRYFKLVLKLRKIDLSFSQASYFAESNLEKEIEKLRNHYRAAQDVGTCPVTGDACETQKVLQKLQKNSERELIKTTEIGLKLKEKIEAAKKEIEDLDVEHKNLKKQLADVELEIDAAQKNLSPMQQVDIITNPRIAKLEAELDALPTSFLKYEELKAKKAAFETYEKAVEKSKERIELLRAEWRAQSAKLQNKKI